MSWKELVDSARTTGKSVSGAKSLPWLAVVWAAAFCLFFGRASWSDTIVFTNGIKIEAEILEEDMKGIKIKLPNGKVEYHSRSEIRTVMRKLPPLFAAAEEQLKAGNLQGAIGAFNKAAAEEKNPFFSERALLRLQQCYIASGRYDQAVRTYVSLLQRNHDTANYAEIPLPRKGDPMNAQAANYLNMAITTEQNPFVKGMMKAVLACILATDKKIDQAKKLLDGLLMASDGRVAQFAKVLYGELAYERGAYQEATDIIQKNLRSLPMQLHPLAYYYLGLSYIGKGDTQRGALCLLRTALMMPHLHEQIAAEGLYMVAREREGKQKWEDALRLYRELIEGFPTSVHVAEARKRASMIEGTPQ